jgi:hypothetical protein
MFVIVGITVLVVWLVARNRRMEREFERESQRRITEGHLRNLRHNLESGNRFHGMFPCPEADNFRKEVREDLLPLLEAKLHAPNPDLTEIGEQAIWAGQRLVELKAVARNWR